MTDATILNINKLSFTQKKLYKLIQKLITSQCPLGLILSGFIKFTKIFIKPKNTMTNVGSAEKFII